MSVTPLDKSLQKIKFLFSMAGMNIEDRSKSWSEIARYILHFICIGSNIVLAILWLKEGASNGLNFIELTHVMPCFALGMMAEFKTSFHIFFEKKVVLLINNLRNLEKVKLSSGEEEMVREETKFLGVLINVLILVNIILLLMFNIGPLILIAVKYYMTRELELILPFLDIYPFDGYDLRYWPFVYAHAMWTSIIVLTDIFALDFLFYTCCTHIKMQFKLLQREIENVVPCNRLVDNGEIREKLRNIVKWHQSVISCADMLEAVYSKSTLYNYLTSSVIICLTGFDVTAIQDMVLVITFATIAVVGMLQIFFICFFGDLLMNSSTEISRAAYNSKWYYTDVSIRKTTLMIQIRANKPCKLTAAGFADVNLKAFMKILSTSWSYFALLQTVYLSFKAQNMQTNE